MHPLSGLNQKSVFDLKSGDKLLELTQKQALFPLEGRASEQAADGAVSPFAEQLASIADPSRTTSNSVTLDEEKKAFQDFVGQTFFGQLISSMRSTLDKPAYLHGGRAEEIFQGQLDQKMTEMLSESSADKIADPMYKLFKAQRS